MQVPQAIGRRKLLTAVALLSWLPRVAEATDQAVPVEVAAEIPGARLVGASRLRYLGLHVYDIRLWSDSAEAASQPSTALLALELDYARSLSGTQIADSALKEMQGIENIDAAQAQAWLARLPLHHATRMVAPTGQRRRTGGAHQIELRPDGTLPVGLVVGELELAALL